MFGTDKTVQYLCVPIKLCVCQCVCSVKKDRLCVFSRDAPVVLDRWTGRWKHGATKGLTDYPAWCEPLRSPDKSRGEDITDRNTLQCRRLNVKQRHHDTLFYFQDERSVESELLDSQLLTPRLESGSQPTMWTNKLTWTEKSYKDQRH